VTRKCTQSKISFRPVAGVRHTAYSSVLVLPKESAADIVLPLSNQDAPDLFGTTIKRRALVDFYLIARS